MRIHCEKEHGRYRYGRNSQASEILGQSDVLAVLLFLGTVMGTVFFNKMSAEMKSTLESWFSGSSTSSEIVSADRYSLFVGVLKNGLCGFYWEF